MSSRPEKLLVVWYADDFTGAAAVLEVLAFAGVNAMLFLDVPTNKQLSLHPNLQAIGIASTARAQSPEWMDENLPSVFESLLEFDAELLHYKICTTLDSSPSIGSIGRVIDIATDLLQPDAVPVLVAAPQMRRYQLFGHLFVAYGDDVYRLDRHPVMAHHPVTPMKESDVAQHLRAQSNKFNVSCWSLEDMTAGRAPVQNNDLKDLKDLQDLRDLNVFTIDCVDEESEVTAGRMLWEHRARNKFVVGSQGVEFALVRHWIKTKQLHKQEPPKGVGQANGMLTVSGSVSPTTAAQIIWSRANGFTAIRFNVRCACGDVSELETEINRVVEQSMIALSNNSDPLVYTAEGPDDPAVEQLRKTVAEKGMCMPSINKSIGVALGQVLHNVLSRSGIRRAIVSGGDTSGYVTQQLGIYALSALAPTIAGASLSRVHAEGPMNGLELALKGGQMGSPDYFGWIRDGGGAR